MHTVFITGCATGFGHHLARRLLALGHRVVATDPDIAGLAERIAGRPSHERLLVRELDVRHRARIDEVVVEALEWAPVDVLVNNAGYAVFNTQEEADLEAIRRLFDVNVLGPARLAQALLPALRAVGGTVVQLSSVAGRMVFPESGYYAATKYAIEAMTEALYQETCTFGVRIRLIQPGSFDTCFAARAARESRPRPADSPYGDLIGLWEARKSMMLEPPQDPELVVDAIVASLDDPRSFVRIPVGPDARRIVALRDGLSPDAWARLAGERAGLDDPGPRDPGDVLGPAEVLAAFDQEPAAVEALVPTALAARTGHLDYWDDDESGRRALALLRTVPVRPSSHARMASRKA